VSGPKKELQTFFAKARGRTVVREESFRFANFLPAPSDIRLLKEALEGTLWGKFADEESAGADDVNNLQYYWRIQCWGTKWEPDVYRYRYPSPTIRSVEFLTAWSPPIPFVRVVSEAWPSLSFLLRYAESGGDFAGEYEIANGREETNDEGAVCDYKFARDWYPLEDFS
jgi:hypothetical protein